MFRWCCRCCVLIAGWLVFSSEAAASCSAAAPGKPAMIALKDARAVIIPAGDLVPDSIEHCGAGRSTVRGSFLVDAGTTNDALSAGGKSIMIFMFDRAKAQQTGCEFHPEIIFSIAFDNPPSPEVYEVEFGDFDGQGHGGMTLGAYHAMEWHGCIAAPMQR